MISEYTHILEEVARTKDSSVANFAISRLITHLKKVGQMNILRTIVRELRKSDARHKALAPCVEVAKEKDATEALRRASALGITADKVMINPLLISGWRARGNGKLIDHSAKYALIKIYQKTTTK